MLMDPTDAGLSDRPQLPNREEAVREAVEGVDGVVGLADAEGGYEKSG